MSDELDDLTPEQLETFGKMLRKEVKAKLDRETQKNAQAEAEAFFDVTESFPRTKENIEILVAYMKQLGLPATRQGFATAHNLLLGADVYQAAAKQANPEPEMTLAQLDALSADDYKKLVNRSAAHGKMVNDLEATRPAPPPRIYNGEHTVRGR